jgi:hypothetical protein
MSSCTNNVDDWKFAYVHHHLEAGHCGLCFAWLDTAFCPLQHMFGKCQFNHCFPKSWSSSKVSEHFLKILIVKELWKDDESDGRISPITNSDSFAPITVTNSKKRRFQRRNLSDTRSVTVRKKSRTLIEF